MTSAGAVKGNKCQHRGLLIVGLNIFFKTIFLTMKDSQFEEITHKIIGSAMRVHRELGNGFQEVIYQRALEIEFQYNGLLYGREVEMPIYYRNEYIGTRRVDFLVNDYITVELKALVKLEVGLLLNFGATSLQFKRLINKKTVSSGI